MALLHHKNFTTHLENNSSDSDRDNKMKLKWNEIMLRHRNLGISIEPDILHIWNIITALQKNIQKQN